MIAREIGFVREDIAKLRARLPQIDLTPQRKTAGLLLLGLVSVVHGFSLWSEAVAWVVLGIALIVSGFVLVDLDPPVRRRRRTVRKKVT